MKKQLQELLGAKVSVRKGTGALSPYTLIQSREINLWENEAKIKSLFPTFSASSAVFGIIK